MTASPAQGRRPSRVFAAKASPTAIPAGMNGIRSAVSFEARPRGATKPRDSASTVTIAIAG